MINPYNWGAAFESDLTEASIGLLSRDILSTTSVSLGYFFDINERNVRRTVTVPADWGAVAVPVNTRFKPDELAYCLKQADVKLPEPVAPAAVRRHRGDDDPSVWPYLVMGWLGVIAAVGIARLVRDGRAAEVAFEVADEYQGRGIGSVLTQVLAADARAAG